MSDNAVGFKRKACQHRPMSSWTDGRRDDPKPCREVDKGKFEVVASDGRARIGKLHTEHGILETPALLPVINPNIRTIEPREMWDRYGIGALITNSYIIWKHDNLREKALNSGVHELIDFPGVIMTDSGTFQSYVYGDVEVGVEEIVKFQKNIGVDIATMLDVFTRPDMTKQEVEQAVDNTIARAESSIACAGETMLNGPIQGGTFKDLREKSAIGMGNYDFAVHPIGGIVPIMEQHMYKDLVKIMLSSIPHLPSSRPRHMFGCGHPMLFPMLVALGADLFDSAAYALFARDGRILCPWGTEKLEKLEHWPIIMPSVSHTSPPEVRKLDEDERTKLLARYNLEITLQEISRCKQAVRDGTIWRLAERRSHQHPALREAFLWLTTNPHMPRFELEIYQDMKITDRDAAKESGTSQGSWEPSWDWVVAGQSQFRTGGIQWAEEDTFSRPYVVQARRLLHSRYSQIGGNSDKNIALVLYGRQGPWRDFTLDLMMRLTTFTPDLQVFIQTPIGLIPYSLEDNNPFAHVEGPEWIWERKLDLSWARRELDRLGVHDARIIKLDLGPKDLLSRCFDVLFENEILDDNSKFLSLMSDEQKTEAKTRLKENQVRDKLAVHFNISITDAENLSKGCTYIMSSTGRIKNIIDKNGEHIASPRLNDGGLSLTSAGAKKIYASRTKPIPDAFKPHMPWNNTGAGLPVVVVEDDAEPFVRKGRNVFHGFVKACDPWLTIDQPALIVNSNGDLLGYGISKSTPEDLSSFTKGIAVKTRGGISLD